MSDTTTTPAKTTRAPRKTAAQKAAETEEAEVQSLTTELLEVWGQYRPAEFSEDQMLQLMSDLNPARVSSRTQGSAKLSYVEAHDIKNTLIRIFGFANFSSELLGYRTENVRPYKNSNGKDLLQVTMSAHVQVTIHQTGARYSEAAVASQSGPDVGEVMDFALKTAESDAFKRCCVFLGTQFGASLYSNGATADQVRVVLEKAQALALQAGRQRQAERGQVKNPAQPQAQQQRPPQQQAQAQRPPQQQQRPPQAAPTPDDQPMATADYSQGDPNANDGLAMPRGGGIGAVASAFNHGRGQEMPPPVNTQQGVEYYSGETFGDNA